LNLFDSLLRNNLLLLLLALVVDDVVEAELVDTLGGGDNAQPVTELLLLEVLLGQVLEVATREGDVSDNLDLALTNLGDDNVVTEVADTALDLDAVVEELLEGGDIEDLVARGLRSVDDVLLGDLLGLATTSLLPRKQSH
jgi:ribosomal RNA-processing protein 12